jgi:hypothetical protein
MYLKRCMQRVYAKGTLLARELLHSALTPQKLSLTLCLGCATGVMPLLWGTTVLCATLAALLKLNQAAMQAVNYLCYPLQLALFLPFCRLGEFLFPWGPRVNGEVLRGALHGHFGASVSLVGWAIIRALGAWLITIAPLAVLVQPVLKGVLRRREEASANAAEPAGPPRGSD